ncbi:streptophobe family protein [Streptomyces sp. NPDC008137]|uniref:streptophobe family protein n=1 Tax=Streptomyces sp. NPDC008137 TaxID=3364813 RepID=UPI0036EE59F9
MSAATSKPRPGRPGDRRVPPVPEGLLPHAIEGAAAALCAVIVMVAISALALSLLDAGSVGSLGPLTAAVTVMAVGGSLSADPVGTAQEPGPGLAGLFGGGMSPSMSGSVDVVPFGVTLVGTVVLWFAFSWRLRHRRVCARELSARATGAGAAALFTLVVLAGLAKGTIVLPASAMSELRGGQGAAGGPGGGAGGSGGLLGRLLGGGGGASSDPTMAFHVSVGSAALGALLWVAVVLGVGCLISRRVKVPSGGPLDRMRPGWAPGLSAVVRMLLLVAAVPLVAVTFVGAVAGGRAATAAGGALLLAPNAVAVFLTLGAGSPWTASMEQVQSQGGNPLAGLLGALGGGDRPAPQPDRTEHLRDVSAGGWPLWPTALVVTGLLLVVCAYVAARHTDPRHVRPLHPYRGPLARHVGLAERFGILTALVMGAACALAGASGRFGVTMFGSEMGGKRALLEGSVPWAMAGGLVVGALAGFGGSLLYRGMTHRPRILPLKTPPAPLGGRKAKPGADPLEVPVAHR